MSFKRSRATFEADLQAQQSPYVLYGSPLPPLDPEVRDDGSYVPVWKQEVRDERGRKRLHGAFTGGFSAGYFNTVGSKEGWTPSTFVSSRTNRRKDEAAKSAQQRVEDFMDDEDLADAAEAEKLQTAQGFAGLGSTEEDGVRRGGGVADLFRVQGETMGVKLLRRMGWKDGQGIGPKVRRKARLDVGGKPSGTQEEGETHLFAPKNVSMIAFVKKLDRKGLGYEGEARLTSMKIDNKAEAGESSDEHEGDPESWRRPSTAKRKKDKNSSGKFSRGGIGMGILNDTGSDDEDPYEVGPRISYNRVIGGDKKKKRKEGNPKLVNPAVRTAPVFKSRKNAIAQSGKNLRRCHDGRLPLDGFVFGSEPDPLTSTINSQGQYPPPQIPPGWKSSKQTKAELEARQIRTDAGNYISTADAAKATKLNPKSRAALLGEAQLPGKSVFDFLSASARNRLASATGKTNLPPALGEIPAEFALSEAERQQELFRQVPELDKQTAIAAMARGASGSAPYADNEAKRGRYRAYLEYAAGFVKTPAPKPPDTSSEDYICELHEFNSCAKIFKPMTGMMASRFTPSTSTSKLSSGSSGKTDQEGDDSSNSLLSKPPPKPKDPAEEAAALGMYGSMTRSVTDFYPTRLLCKRFNVRPPAHVQPDQQDQERFGSAKPATASSSSSVFTAATGIPPRASVSMPIALEGSETKGVAMTLDELLRQAQGAGDQGEGEGSKWNDQGAPLSTELPRSNNNETAPVVEEVKINADVNEAIEGKRAQEEVLRAIFGDSSDDDEDDDA